MASEVFIDSSGFHAILVKKDARHAEALEFLGKCSAERRRLATTDYVIDETATLLEVRGLSAAVPRLFESVFASKACRLIWMDADRFEKARALFLRHLGRRWSFTDCTSFAVMREHRIGEALTTDSHFREAGFEALLA
jgi:hypothetical protein